MIQKIKLTNFRNFKNKILDFSDQITVIVGPNASGKTNILESLFVLSTGKSFKAKIEEEMVNYDRDFSKVKGRIKNFGIKVRIEEDINFITDLELTLTRGFIDIGAEHPEKVPRKKMTVNNVSKRLIDFAGNFKVVLFGPWDMDLVTESPSIRRKFLDTVLSQVDREYRRSILSYEKGLRQRNKLLFRIREEGISRSQLLFWNQLLIKAGDYISSRRKEFVDFVNGQKSLNDQKFRIEYDNSVMSEGRLEQYADEEVAAATTLVGPHRDDFIFFEQKRNLASYGSRGEQRMAVLWLKMAELNFIEEKTGERPTLLLDDIFSELDHTHRDVVMRLAEKQQTVITTADDHFVSKTLKGSAIIRT